jgi:8-oxo-dGTP pyrophosphatase MutT (NUDIX family)
MIVGTAGIAIVYQNKLLIVHPTGSGWSNLGIPKGHIEDGESIKDTAIRETFEETGIKVKESSLSQAHFLDYPNGKKRIYYFIYKIDDLSEIGLSTETVPKSQLDLKEVDWAGFVPFDKAAKLMYKPQVAIIKNINLNESKSFKIYRFDEFSNENIKNQETE